jgi:hypothetical protein
MDSLSYTLHMISSLKYVLINELFIFNLKQENTLKLILK